jgi:hypothetical protein
MSELSIDAFLSNIDEYTEPEPEREYKLTDDFGNVWTEKQLRMLVYRARFVYDHSQAMVDCCSYDDIECEHAPSTLNAADDLRHVYRAVIRGE